VAILLFKLVFGILAVVVLVPLSILLSLPFILIQAWFVDRNNYWPSVAFRIKEVAKWSGEIAGIFGSSM
jgi:hypothetical protein